MRTRVASTRLIGRAAELAELETAVAEAADGRASLAFVAGESGIGKTRLLAELTRRAREGGALVLTGDCADFGDEGDLPYLPLVAALRPLARLEEPGLSGPAREAVAPLLPGSDTQGGAAAEPGGQARLFEGLLSLLEALGQERPVVLVIEDLHWADRSTWAALTFLARNLTGERVLLVGSYRSDELRRRDPLRAQLAELELHPRARRIVLDPFSRAELAEQLADILDGPPAGDLLQRLWERAGGNPLYGEELLAAGLDGRGDAPDTLRDALMLRIERLPEPARELLELVAVGRRVDHRLLEETSGLDPAPLRGALREAVDAHVLTVQDGRDYRFRHALLREVVESELLPGERSELNLRVARALEQRLEDGADAQAIAAVAHHYAATDDVAAAFTTAVRAAAAAEEVHAHDEVAALLDRALALWDRVPDAAALAGADRITLLARAGDAASALGDPARHLARLEAAFAQLDPRAEPSRAAGILEATARAQRHLNRAAESAATLERALELAADDVTRAGVLAALARAQLILDRNADAARTARAAMELATSAGLPLVEGRARNTLGSAVATTGAVDEADAELRAAIAIARERGATADLAEGYLNYANMLHAIGRTEAACAVVAEGKDVAGRRRPIAMLWLDLNLAEFAFEAGDWAASEACLPSALPWTGGQSRVGIGLRRAALAAGRGDLAAASALVEELEPLAANSSEPQILRLFGALLAELRRREGDLERARAAVETGLARIDGLTDDPLAGASLAAGGVPVEADAAQRARDLGDDEAADAALRRAEALLERVEAAAPENRPVEQAALAGARAEAGRAAGAPDAAEYGRAAAAWDAAGRPEPAAIMRFRAAEAHAGAGDATAALEAARAAHATAVRLGAGWLRGELERLAARARLPLAPHDTAAGEEPPEDGFGLTSRERQVLALLTEGATNREIGATLFMAEKTASVHVSRILAKLNARSRTEAASIAHRQGLVPHTVGRDA